MKAFTVLLWLLPALAAAQSPTSASPPAWETGIETSDGTCGVEAGVVCTPTWGACCSKDNVCGRSAAFCGTGCQPLFGNCNAPVPTPAGPGSASPDGSCGGTSKYTCVGSTFGNCCSSSNFCGTTDGHCGPGCQSSFGNCTTGADTISTDGMCGANGKTCKGSTYGDCCGSSGYCGSTDGHCSAGCQSAFGTCSSTSTGGVSTDGKCGANGMVCTGSLYGDCCSSSGFCGNTTAFCNEGCQTGFGTCTGASSISIDGDCSTNGKTCKGSTFGDCCSSSNFCGSSTAFCTAGCQSGFGDCTGAGNISTDGACSKNGKTCKGSTFGDCCSSSGFCGKTSDFCDAGCQTGFGDCSTASGSISTDGSCGKNGKTCTGSTFGDCCSSSGFCGKTSDFCGAGCQSGSGTCSTTSNISTDGACGKNGKTCKGSAFGDCCSSSGFCGKTTDFCDAGCQATFGTCSNASGSISTDGACGKNGKTCKGSTFGDCCSSSGFCGKTTAFCDSGCQPTYGSCNTVSSSISTDGVCGTKNSKTCVGSTFGNCCSSTGSCGSTANHCGQGCQKTASSACLTTNIPSIDGSCGTSKGGWTCAGGDFNNQCCSSSGFCGTTTVFCGTGCQKNFGRCI